MSVVWQRGESAKPSMNGVSRGRYLGGGGASTLRSPLCSGGVTTPAASIASIRRASISGVQRRLKIGYNRAASR